MVTLRIIFMGTAEIACPSLAALHEDQSYEILAVVSQPDRPQGRNLQIQPSPVKKLAVQKNLPVLQPNRARDESFLEQIQRLRPDLIIVAAYGQILPSPLLSLPRYGCINVHASLLPKYRGAAPIQCAILNDEAETGITIMQMDAGLDTGPILSMSPAVITEEDNAQTLHDRLAVLGAGLLLQTIPGYVAGRIPPQPQPTEGATYAHKITREDGHLDWKQPARELWNRIRAFTPWPGTYAYQPATPKPRKLKIWSAKIEPEISGPAGQILQASKSDLIIGCGQQSLRLLELQREGGRRLGVKAFLAGNDLAVGTQLT